MTFILKQRRKE